MRKILLASLCTALLAFAGRPAQAEEPILFKLGTLAPSGGWAPPAPFARLTSCVVAAARSRTKTSEKPPFASPGTMSDALDWNATRVPSALIDGLFASPLPLIPDDVKAVAIPVLAHRIVLRPDASSRGLTHEGAVHELLAMVPVPAGR